MLSALPAHSLTHLDLTLPPTGMVDAAALSSALARLTNLQQLRLEKWQGLPMAGSCLGGILQLCRLTMLQLGGNWWGDNDNLAQVLAQPLPLRRLELNPQDTLPVLDLSKLEQLEQLTVQYDLPDGSALPVQLQQLHLEAWEGAGIMSALLPLQQLQRLSLFQGFAEQQPLLPLAQLPALQHVSLQYSEPHEAAAAAAAWPQLPQLRALSISFDDHEPLPSQVAAILDAIAASTQLTRLSLAARRSRSGDADAVQPVAACSKLAGLKNLRDLRISPGSKLVPGDVRALTALTGLTRLRLSGLGPAVDDAAAIALPCSLKQLQHLDLGHCELGNMACCAAIGQLVQLTELVLQGCSGLTRAGLLMMAGLSHLQQLRVEGSRQLLDAHLQEFWAAVRHKH